MGFFNRVSAAEYERVKQQRDTALTDLADATLKVETLEADLRTAALDADEWKAAAIRYEDATRRLETEIARLKPLAEATERRRANDAKRVRPSRVKTAPATGKPRTAIPAKVGQTAKAKLSGDRPAKKGVRK